MSREFFHKEIDDVHPLIMKPNNPYIQKSEWLWVIPLYMNDPISNHPEWVDQLKKTGKKIGLHGVKHTHKEFEINLSKEYIDSGVQEFKKAFGYKPTHFKAPSLALTDANRKIIESYGMEVKGRFNQIMHNCGHAPNHRKPNGELIGE